MPGHSPSIIYALFELYKCREKLYNLLNCFIGSLQMLFLP